MRQHNLRVTGSLTINGENVISASELSTLSASINSKIEGLNPSQIGTGSYTASISPNGVFSVNTNTIITGSLSVTSLSGSGVNYLAYSGGIVTAISGTAAIKYTQEFTATLGQTIFTPSVGYVSGLIDVFYNGTKLSATDYTATNGYNISLVQGADLAGDIIEIDIYNPVSGVSNNVLRQQTTFTASVSQTTFSVNYTPGLIDVFFNGSRLANEEYTANNGTSIILSEATTGGEILDIFVYSYQVGAFSGIGGQGQSGQFAYFSSQNGISGSSIIAISGSDIITGGDIIPSQSGSYDLGSLEKPFRHIYVGTGSIYLVDNSGQVTNTISAQSIVTTDTLNSGTIDLTKSLPTGTVSGSSQIVGILSSLNSFSASNDNTSLNSKTGSYATTGSNSFYGTQVFSGSVYIANDLVVQGSSSIQYISASSVSIGTNIIQLNTANPTIRYAGLSIIDSGSIGGSGSFLYDSVQDEFIFVHRGNGTNITSSHFVLGPETYDSLGNESYLTTNLLPKGTGKEHLIDSCIFDNGTTTCIKNNLIGTGTIDGTIINSTSNAFRFSGNNAISLVSLNAQNVVKINAAGYWGTQLVGANDKGILIDNVGNIGVGTTSTAVHANAGYTTLTIAGGNVNRGWLEIGTLGACTNNIVGNISAFAGTNARVSEISFATEGAANLGNISFSTYCNGINTKLLISNSGISCFACQVCAPKFIATHLAATCLTLNGFSSGNGFKMDYGNASGQITAINLMANGTTNGFIGIQMVDGSNGDLWFGSSANRSMTVYRTTGHVGFGIDAPCTRVHAEGGYGSRWGGNGCFYGGGISGGGMPYGDEYGNGASYTYQACNTNANNSSLWGGFAAGYFKGGPGQDYGGGGAGIVAIGGNGGNAESVNAGGGAGIFARGGKNGAGSLHSYAGWFDGGNVMIRCGFLGVNNTAPRTFVHIVGASCGADVACGFGNADARGILHVQACTGADNSNITVENAFGIGQFMQWTSQGMRIGHRILKGGSPGDVHMTAGQDGVKLLIYANGNLGAPSGSNIYNASDCRLKKNIRTISYGLCDVMKLQPKIFNWKDNFTPSENGKEMLGFVAQDIQTIIPEVVEQFSDGSDITFDCQTITNPLRVNEKFIIPILTKAIQDQQSIIQCLTNRIEQLENK